MAMADLIDPTRAGKYPIVLSDELLGKKTKTNKKSIENHHQYTGIRYAPPSSSSSSSSSYSSYNSGSGLLKPSTTAKDSFNLSVTDQNGNKYSYAGTRSTNEKQYVLVFDPERKVMVLHRLDSMFNMHLSTFGESEKHSAAENNHGGGGPPQQQQPPKRATAITKGIKGALREVSRMKEKKRPAKTPQEKTTPAQEMAQEKAQEKQKPTKAQQQDQLPRGKTTSSPPMKTQEKQPRKTQANNITQAKAPARPPARPPAQEKTKKEAPQQSKPAAAASSKKKQEALSMPLPLPTTPAVSEDKSKKLESKKNKKKKMYESEYEEEEDSDSDLGSVLVLEYPKGNAPEPSAPRHDFSPEFPMKRFSDFVREEEEAEEAAAAEEEEDDPEEEEEEEDEDEEDEEEEFVEVDTPGQELGQQEGQTDDDPDIQELEEALMAGSDAEESVVSEED